MKKIYLALVAMLISFNAHAFIISPHVGLDYVSATPNGFGDIDSLNGGAVSAGVKVLGFLSAVCVDRCFRRQQNKTCGIRHRFGFRYVESRRSRAVNDRGIW